MTNQIPKACTPKEDFIYLTPEVRKSWSKTPNDMEALTLRSRTVNRKEGVNTHTKNIHKTVKHPSLPPRKFTKANLHELLAELLSEASLSEQNEIDVSEDELKAHSTLQVNSTSENATNPGNSRKLTHAPGKSKDAFSKQQTAFSKEITVKGQDTS